MRAPSRRLPLGLLIAAIAVLLAPTAAAAHPPDGPDAPRLLTEGLDGAFGSTIGPDGALYVTEGIAGRIARIDPETGATTVFADCLPERILPVGGATDVAFVHGVAYALVTLVDPYIPVPGSDVSGIYRIDGPDSCTPVADIGTWAVENPPDADIFLASGVQFAFEPYRHGFVVTDGHHNRLIRVDADGTVSEAIQFPNIVPTGLDVRGTRIYMAEAGPVPHEPEDGVVVQFRLPDPSVTEVASGAPLLVDVELGRGHHLYGLAQGDFPDGSDPGTPAIPGTGQLLDMNRDGTFRVLTEGLDQPTSLSIIGDTAYVVTLTGQVWVIDDLPVAHNN